MKNSKKREGGGSKAGILPKKNHCKFKQVNANLQIFAKKKRNEISNNRKGGGVKGHLDFFQKNIGIWRHGQLC